MACTPNELTEAAKCFCFSFEQHLQIQTYLLCQIVLNGGGGGGGGGGQQWSAGSGSPVGVFTPEIPEGDPIGGWFDTDTGEIWQYYNGDWH